MTSNVTIRLLWQVARRPKPLMIYQGGFDAIGASS
jgi:hypothetical protein